MDKFISEENIKHFTTLLCEEGDPKKRELLLRLIAEEQVKLRAALDAAERRIKDSNP